LAALGGAVNFAGVGAIGNVQGRIKRIDKVFNCVLYEKFINEFKRMIRKYPGFQVTDILKHLFHGSRGTDPKLIYGTEDGLDIRFSNSGVYGQGVYFADNAQYSHTYHHPTSKGECQMFLALVLVGDSVTT
jgi:Poly(ADP-ribose) polymerase catalytic domain